MEASAALPDSLFAQLFPVLIRGDCLAMREWGQREDLSPYLAGELIAAIGYAQMNRLAYALSLTFENQWPGLSMWDFMASWYGSVGPAGRATVQLIDRIPGEVIEFLLSPDCDFVSSAVRTKNQPAMKAIKTRSRGSGSVCNFSRDPFKDLDQALSLITEVRTAPPNDQTPVSARLVSPRDTPEILRVWLRSTFRERFNVLHMKLNDYDASGAFLAGLAERFPDSPEVTLDRYLYCHRTGDRSGCRAAAEKVIASSGDEFILAYWAKTLIWVAGGKAERGQIGPARAVVPLLSGRAGNDRDLLLPPG